MDNRLTKTYRLHYENILFINENKKSIWHCKEVLEEIVWSVNIHPAHKHFLLNNIWK